MVEIAAQRGRGAARGRPFEKGRSGNPGGRLPGSRNRATLAAEALLDGEADALTRRAVELAIEGDPTALKLCLERILAPRRERVVRFALPPIESAADIARAMGAITAAVAEGDLTPGEAGALAAVVDTFVHAIDISDFERRLQALEADAARMTRLTAHATAADSAAAWHTLALEARAAIGTALRQALAELAIDPATVPMLRVSDEAAQELRTAGDGAKTDAAAPALAGDQRHEAAAEAFATRIEGLAQRYNDGQEIDFTHASLAEMLAWYLARCKANGSGGGSP